MKDGYLRITEVLKPFSGIEFVPQEILQPAAERGSAVHEHIENWLAGVPIQVEDEEHKGYVESFIKYWKENEHAFKNGKITLEKRLYCEKHKLTGQADCLIEVGDRTYIIDWKTSSRAHKPVWMLQGAGYKHLAVSNGYKNIDGILFVKLDKKGKKPSLYKFDNLDDGLILFFKCLELYRFFEMDKTRGFHEYK